MSNKKKIVIICTMVVMLVAAAYLNVLLANKTNNKNNVGASNQSSSNSVSVFSAMKTDRDSVRAQNYAYLDTILQSDTASAEAKASAEQEKLNLIKCADSELVLENLIKARGFEDACVTMTTENVNVVVKDAELSSTDVAQILGIVTEETGCKATNVIIVPYASVS